jgi:hypothetical protein
MRLGKSCALTLWALSTLAALPARANPNDFRLNARRDGQLVLIKQNGDSFVADTDAWRNLIGELAYVVAPRLASPAETLGHAGFSVGALWSGTVVSADQPYWSVTENGTHDAPSGLLQTLQLDIRKGLPFSFELGVNLVWVISSELFAPGMEVRWALQEGYKLLPDFGLRGSVNHVVGNRDVNMTVTGLDAVVSKGFGLFGMINVAPYLSWSLLFVSASSHVIDPTPTIEADIGNNLVFPELNGGDNVHHKLTIGARMLASVLNLTVQGEFEMLRKTPDGTKFFGNVGTISTKLGLDF